MSEKTREIAQLIVIISAAIGFILMVISSLFTRLDIPPVIGSIIATTFGGALALDRIARRNEEKKAAAEEEKKAAEPTGKDTLDA